MFSEYSGPLGERLAEWERKEELKFHKIDLFCGRTDLEGQQEWFASVEYYCCLAGCAERQIVGEASKHFSSEVLRWFATMLRLEYGVTSFPPPHYPLGWAELKSRIQSAYAL